MTSLGLSHPFCPSSSLGAIPAPSKPSPFGEGGTKCRMRTNSDRRSHDNAKPCTHSGYPYSTRIGKLLKQLSSASVAALLLPARLRAARLFCCRRDNSSVLRGNCSEGRSLVRCVAPRRFDCAKAPLNMTV